MSATTGSGEFAQISRSASAACISGTAQRTMSQPASASARICARVACASRVSVLVMDCTAMGAPPPTNTSLILICFVIFIALTSHKWKMENCGIALYAAHSFSIFHSQFSITAHKNAQYVLPGHIHHQHKQQHESCRVHIALVLGRHGLAADALDDEEHEPTAVQCRQRQ